MSSVSASSGSGVVSQAVQMNKSKAEQALNQAIREVVQDPAKNLRELQQPSPLSQFLDIKI
ncbi:hypothetical protein ACFSCX_23040 [Bacillus salitolerans]|uniref:Motility protein n=1 Tax=Bacillus salitolerans TaxID=1437434 RepID=A0ABW4LY61_9BACI